jgi:hypothetical protein
VYAAAIFDVARAQYDLIVCLKLPYMRYSQLAAYSVQTHALKVYRGDQGFVTILQNPPSIILADRSSGVIGELRQ